MSKEQQRGDYNLSREGEENTERSESQRSERQMGALAIIVDTELLISIRCAAE